MASVATKRRADNKSYKIKYKALNELEKGTPYKDIASLFRVPKIPYRHGKRTKTKSLKSITAALFQKEENQRSTRNLTKLSINGSLFYEVKMFQSVGQCSRKRVSNSPED